MSRVTTYSLDVHIYRAIDTHIYRQLYKNVMVITIQKSIVYIYTHKSKKNSNITLQIVIKSQEKNTKE